MNLRTFFALIAGSFLGALSRPAKAITTDSGARWLPVTLQTPQGPIRLLLRAKLPIQQEQPNKATIGNVTYTLETIDVPKSSVITREI